MNTISWSSPTTPLPMEINPRVVFERHVRRRPARRRSARRARSEQNAACSTRFREEAADLQTRARARATARASATTSTTSARSNGAFSRPRRTARRCDDVDAPVGVPDSFEEHVGLMFDLLAVGLSGRRDARVHVHDVARAQPADVSADRRHRAAPFGVAPRQRSGQDREERASINTYHMQLFAKFSRSCARRRTATARCSITR